MATFDQDPLTDTSGNVNGSSTIVAGSPWGTASAQHNTPFLFSSAGNCYPGSLNSGYSGNILAGVPAGTDYDVTFILKFYSTKPTGGNAVVGVSFHNVTDTGTADLTGKNCYFAGFNFNIGTPSLDGWGNYYYYAGSYGAVGSPSAYLYTTAAAATGGIDPVTGATLGTGEFGVKVTVRTSGGTTTITTFVNGVSTCTGTNTQSILQNKGYAGIIQHPTNSSPAHGDTTGIHLRSFQVTDYVAVGFSAVTPTAIPTGHAGNMTLTLTGTGTSWGGGTTFTVTNTSGGGASQVTKVSQNVVSGTSATLVVTTSSGTANTFTVSDGTYTSSAITIAVPAMTASPPAIALAGGPQTVTFTETVNGSASLSQLTNEQLTSTSTGVATIGTTSAWTNGVATATVTPVSSGSTTFTNTSDPAVAAFSITSAFPIYGSSTIVKSPYNWVDDGTVNYTGNQGAYLHTVVTTTGVGNVTLTYDGTNTAGAGLLMWMFTGAGLGTQNGLTYGSLSGTTAGSSITLYTNLPVGTYDLFIQVAALSYFSGTAKWANASASTRPGSIFLPGTLTLSGGGSLAAPTAKSKNIMILGDSITIGASNTVNGQTAQNLWAMDASIALTNFIGAAYNAEYGVLGWGGSGLTVTSGEGVPPWWSAAGTGTKQPWNAHNAGQLRTVSGLYSPAPTYIIDLLYTNDYLNGKTSNQVRDVYHSGTTGLIKSLRDAAGSSAYIILLPPPGNTLPNAKSDALALYQAAFPSDTRVFAPSFASAGSEVLAGLNGTSVTGPAGLNSLDSVHPNRIAHGKLAASYVRMIDTVIIASGGGTSNGTFSRMRGFPRL